MPWSDITAMPLPFLNGAILFVGVLLYALLGGADFGGGVWDLLASGPRAAAQREVIARAIGPIWEANHVWLIFVIVLVFTVFPPVYAALSIALYIPFSLALLGIVFRGAAFIFRTPARGVAGGAGAWDRVFAIASTVTPVLFGMAAGAVASGQIRVAAGQVESGLWATWLAPFPLAVGAIALTICAYLAAVYLTLETTGELQEDFRVRALASGLVFAALAAITLPLMQTGAPQLWQGLTAKATVILPVGLGLAFLSGWAVYHRRYRLARVAAAAEVAALLAGWAWAQYPYLIVPDLTFQKAAAAPAMQRAALIVFGLGALFLIPSLWFLYRVFKRELPGAAQVRHPPPDFEVLP